MDNPPSKDTHSYIGFLDGLRFFAIFFVIINHLGIFLPYLKNRQFLTLYKHFSGTAGVQIFFVISGFLIFWRLSDEYSKNGKINFKRFYIRRFTRLLPLFLVFITLVVILSLFNFISLPLPSFFMAIGYVYNFVPKSHYTGELGHLWSLSVEEQFYLIIPSLFLLK